MTWYVSDIQFNQSHAPSIVLFSKSSVSYIEDSPFRIAVLCNDFVSYTNAFDDTRDIVKYRKSQ